MMIGNKVFTNPLTSWEPHFIGSWAEWRKLWGQTNLLEVRHGLLYCGFQVETRDEGDQADRLLFYLELADGHNNLRAMFEDEGQYRGYKTGLGYFKCDQDVREALARKAYQVLSAAFFKLGERAGQVYWACNHADPCILEKLITFFRVQRPIQWGYYLTNARGDTPADMAARNFAAELCRHVWRPDSDHMPHDESERVELEQRFKQCRPQLVRILCGLGQYDHFFDSSRYPWDHRTLLMLKNMSVGRDPQLPIDRWNRDHKPEWIKLGDALATGSPTAKVLNNLLCIGREQKRRARIEQAKRVRREAEQRLQEALRL